MARPKKNLEEAKQVLKVDNSLVALAEENRVAKLQKLRFQQKAMESLDEHVMEALDGLYELMRDDDKYVRLRAIEIVLKKVIPEKKVKEIVGADGGPVQINQNVDIRALVLDAAVALDSIDVEELLEASRNGSIKTININPGTEGSEEG
jgi:hypothetical protein